MRACRSMRAKRGTAKAARMPRMTMTTTSSMSVKPRCEDLDIFSSETNSEKEESLGIVIEPQCLMLKRQTHDWCRLVTPISHLHPGNHFPHRQHDPERQHADDATHRDDQQRLDGRA